MLLQLLLTVPLIVIGLFLGTIMYRYSNCMIVSIYVYAIVVTYIYVVLMFWYDTVSLIVESCIYVTLLLTLLLIWLHFLRKRHVTR